MGFGNEDANIQALRQAGGEVNGAVNILVKQQNERRATNNADSALMQSLINMGFKDEVIIYFFYYNQQLTKNNNELHLFLEKKSRSS